MSYGKINQKYSARHLSDQNRKALLSSYPILALQLEALKLANSPEKVQRYRTFIRSMASGKVAGL